MYCTILLPSLAVIVALTLPVEALPSRMAMPHNAHKIAFDEVNKRLIAFDSEGRNLGNYHTNTSPLTKRDGEPFPECYPMTMMELNNFPNLPKMRDIVRSYKDFPDNVKYKVVVNDPDINTVHRTAEVCASNKGVIVKDKLLPLCRTEKSTPRGWENGGKLVYQQIINTVVFPKINVQRHSFYGKRNSFTVNNVTGIWEDKLDFQFTNHINNLVRVKKSESLQDTVRIPIDHSPNCNVFLPITTCILSGSVEVALVLRGWIWFEYEKKVGPKDDKHWKWAFPIEKLMPKEEDRCSLVSFRISGERKAAHQFTHEGCSDKEFDEHITPLIIEHW